jgi:hypothetical protein
VHEVSLSQVLELVGDHGASGRSLLEAVLGVQGVAGSGRDALEDQRALLGRVFQTDDRFGRLAFEDRLGACAVAGCFLYVAAQPTSRAR